MSVPKIMALRMGVYLILISYLAGDLFFFKGPIYKTLNTSPQDTEKLIAEAKASGVVARVYQRPIYRAQVEEALREYLWRRGRIPEDTSSDERLLLRELILQQLIDEELIKLQIKVSMAKEVAVPEEKVRRTLEIEKRRYPDGRVFTELAKRASWAGEKEREMRLAARIQRADYLENRIPDEVNTEEAQNWYEENKEKLSATFEESKESIMDALSLKKRDVMWKKFRYEKLRHYAEGNIDTFKDVLHAEEGE